MGDDDVELALDAIQLDLAAGIGRVVAAGARAESMIDRRVLVGPIDPCGECEICRRGGAPVCPSARRRTSFDGARAIAAARWLVPLGDGLELASPSAAAVAGDVVLAYTLYARTGVAPRDPVVVVGQTPIARLLVEILIAKGIAPGVLAAPGAWADWLTAKGASAAPDRAGLAEAFATQGVAAKPWRVVCADPAATEHAAALAGPRATLTLLATPAALAGELIAREVVVIGVAGAHPDLVVEAAAMCVKGEVDLAAATTTETAPASAGAVPRTRVRSVA